jgi:hypothetical protein
MDSISKFTMHFVNQRWSHILNAFWGKTGIAFKTLIIIFALISFAAYASLFSITIKKIIKIKKNENT